MKQHYRKLLGRVLLPVMIASQVSTPLFAQHAVKTEVVNQVVPFKVEGNKIINPIPASGILEIKVSSTVENPGEDYSGDMLFDNNLNTYWEAENQSGASITIILNEPKDVKKLEMTPYINEQLDGSIASYKLEMGQTEDSLSHVTGGSFYTRGTEQVIELDKTQDNVKVIKLTSLTGVSSKLALSEMRIFESKDMPQSGQVGVKKLPAQKIVSIKAESTDKNTLPSNAADDNNKTYWQSESNAVGPGLSTSVEFELDDTYPISELSLLPRQDHASNGGIKSYDLYMGETLDAMTHVQSGELASASGKDQPAQVISFKDPITAKHVKINIKSGVGDIASIAELGVYIAQSKENDTSIKYAGCDIEGVTYDFDIQAGKNDYDLIIPEMIKEKPQLHIRANSELSTVEIVEPEGNQGTYKVTVTAQDGQVEAYTFNVRELAFAGDEIPIQSVKGTGKQYGSDGPNNTIDRNKNTKWQVYTTVNGADANPTLTMTLAEPTPVQELKMEFRQDHVNGGVTAYEVWAGNDENNLKHIKTGKLDTPYTKVKDPQVIELGIKDPVKYVRLIPTAAHEIVAITEVYLKEPNEIAKDSSLVKAEYTLDDGKTWETIRLVSGKTDYTIEMAPFQDVVPRIRVESKNKKADIKVDTVSEVEGTVTAHVTSQDGLAKTDYNFVFDKREAAVDATLKSVKYNGQNLVLAANKYDYNVNLPKDTAEVDLIALPTSQYASVKINGQEMEVSQLRANKYKTIAMKDGKATAEVEVTAEDTSVTKKYTINFVVDENSEVAQYSQDFSNKELVNWVNITPENPAAITVTEDEKLHIATAGVPKTVILDENAPVITDGKFKVEFTTDAGDATWGVNRFGFVLRGGAKEANWGTLAYDVNGKWMMQGRDSYTDELFNYKLEPNTTYNLEVELVGKNMKVTIDGKEVYNKAVEKLPEAPGKFGYVSWYVNDSITLDNIEISEIKSVGQPARPADAQDIVIGKQTKQGEEFQILVDSAFPRIMEYKINGETAFKGQEKFVSAVNINGKTYYPSKVDYTETADGVEYTIHIEKEGKPYAEIDSRISLSEEGNAKKTGNHIVNIDVTDIRELTSEKIKTIEFANQNLVTIAGEEAGYGAIKVTGGGITESKGYVKDLTGFDATKQQVSYPLIFNDKYVAAIDNNVVDPDKKINITKDGAYEEIRFSSGAFTHRYFDSFDEVEAYPTIQIIISGDGNKDDVLDWQDAAIAFREIMPVPKGSEDIKDTVWWIAMNFTSSASNPFVRVLDNGKVLSHYYDGFGQMILNKGYQAEGHDDSHPDYSSVGIRQGGAKDFNLLGEEGEKYNIQTGIHINATEYMLDAVNTKLENLQGGEIGNLNHGWAWLDASYHVDQYKDLESGELERRLDELNEVVPTLDFVYIDVYYKADYHAKKFAEMVNENWTLATEFAGPFEGNQVFTHWGTDLYYPGSSAESPMYRFLYNSHKDAFNPDELLKGMQMPGVASWGNVTNMSEGVEIFYNQNLPTKYMQYSPIIKQTPDRVDFENGTYVQREGSRIKLYSPDNNLVADMSKDKSRCKTTLFMPWNPVEEDKIYYWNNDGGETNWTLPNSWDGVETTYLYELTSTGRKYVGEVAVENNQVTLDLPAQVPYILEDNRSDTNDLPQETVWGEGTLVNDPGFNSLEFGDGWQKSSTSGSAYHIEMIRREDKEFYDNKLKVSGTNDAYVWQEVKDLKPGKTYTVSAWVSTDRLVQLGMEIDGRSYTGEVDNNDITSNFVHHRYQNLPYQRIRFDVTVPQGVDTAKLFLNIPGTTEEAVAWIDDVRIFEQPGHTDRNKDGAEFFEDFENVDEGWGPFEYTGGSSKNHLAYQDPEERQIKSYAFDGEWSFKIADNKTGPIVRTNPSHLKFAVGDNYSVSFDYTLFSEMYGETIAADMAYPYDIVARRADGSVIEKKQLTPSTIGEGVHNPSVETITLDFVAEEGTYITIDTPNGMPNIAPNLSTSTAKNPLMVDNFKVINNDNKIEQTIIGFEPIKDITIDVGETYTLPEKVTANYAHGSTGQLDVTWDASAVNTTTAGVYRVVGTVAETEKQPTLNVVVKNPEAITIKTMLSGSDEVEAGESITITVGIDEVVDPVHAGDLTITYDKNKLELNGIKSIDPTMVAGKQEAPGIVRILTSNQIGLVEKTQLLSLNFTAKDGKETSDTTISLTSGLFGTIVDGVAQTVATDLADKTITIKVTPVMPGDSDDVNKDDKVDIADLAMVAYYYTAKVGDSNWSEAKKADVNGDGVIDIRDLAKVASKILEK